jgi:hypothetical protein
VIRGIGNGLFDGFSVVAEHSQRPLHRHAVTANPFTHESGLRGFGWNLYLLVFSLGLVWVGARARARGPVYVGAVGLFAFAISVTTQPLGPQLAGIANHSGLVGWPLALLVLGVAGLALPALYTHDER